MQTLIRRIKLYLLKREIAKWNAHIGHLRQAQYEIVHTVFTIENEQIGRLVAVAELKQLLCPTRNL